MNETEQMNITELIRILTKAREMNGEMLVALCVDGKIRPTILINCVDDTLYIEGYSD